MQWCSQMFLNPHNWHLMRPISALPGHVLQLPHRRQPVSQSAAWTLSSHCACDDGAKQQQRFHETLSTVNNNVCFLILPVHTCEKYMASQASITQADKHEQRLCVCLCAFTQLLFFLGDQNAVAGQFSAVRLTSIFSSDWLDRFVKEKVK